MRIPLHDLEGARIGDAEVDLVFPKYIMSVKHHDGRVGRREFIFKNGGRYQQMEAIVWRDPPCRRCGRDKDHPVHHGQDVVEDDWDDPGSHHAD